MNVKRPIILFLGVLILGMLIAYEGVASNFKLLLIFVAIFLYGKLYFQGKIKYRLIIILVLFLLLGFYRFKVERNIYDTYEKNVLSLGKGNKIITGRVCKLGKSSNSNFILLSMCESNGVKLGTCRCYFSDEQNVDVKIGNLVKLEAGTVIFENPSNEGEFNQKNYYRSTGISFTSFLKSIEVSNENYDKLKQLIYEIKIKIKNKINEIFDKDDAGLFSAMITGDKSSISKIKRKLFNESGIAHILAISGLHLSILGLFLFEFLRKKFSVNISAFAVSMFILFYGIFIDAGASSLRAIIMLYIRFLSLSIGRTYDSKNALYIICFIFLLLKPYLLFNSGFQFSYVAIFALNYEVYIKYEKKDYRVPSVIILTLFLFPITIYNYFTYPLYSIFLNLIVIPLMSFVLGFGIISLFAGFIFLPLSKLIALVVHVIFYIYDKLCNFIFTLPYHTLWCGKPNLYEVLYYYIALFLVIYVINKRDEKMVIYEEDNLFVKIVNKFNLFYYKTHKHIRFFLCLLLLILSVLIISIRKHYDMRLTILSIGQGDSLMIENNENIITIDGGSSSNKSAGEYILSTHIKSRAISHVDHAFISHSDSDHTNAIMYLIENEDDIKPKNLYLPINAKLDAGFQKIIKVASESEVNIVYLKEGDKLSLSKDLSLEVINPDVESIKNNSKKKKKDKLDENDMSLSFKMYMKKHTALFLGDIGIKTENRMLLDDYVRERLNAEILKVPHHGSKNSNNKEFFDLIKPKFAVISYGKNNTYGHPHQVTVNTLRDTGAKILKTADMGQLDIYLESEDLYYTTYK